MTHSTLSLDTFTKSPYQTPRIHKTCPQAKRSLAKGVLIWLEGYGLKYDPWQQLIFEDLFAVDANGNWANSEQGVLASRQQGKSRIIAGYILAHLFLFPSEKLETQKVILVSAHLVETAGNIYKIVRSTIKSYDDLDARTEKLLDTLGNQEVLATPAKGQAESMGNTIKFRSRQRGAGRGFSAQILVFDEAQIMSQDALNALDYTQSTFSNTQMVFMGTVPQPEDVCEVFEDLRDRGRTPAGQHDSVGWAEWSPEGADDPDKANAIDFSSIETWAQAVPSLGYRITVERIEKEWEKNCKNPEGFAKERLSIWPSRRAEEDIQYNDLDLDKWDGYGLNRTDDYGNLVPKTDDEEAELVRASHHLDRSWAIVPFVTQGGGYTSVCAATKLKDGRIAFYHLRSDKYKSWLADYLLEQLQRFPKSKVFVDPRNMSVAKKDFFKAGLEPIEYQMTQVADAFAEFHLLYEQGQVTHYNQPETLQGFTYAQPRKIGNVGYTWESSNPEEVSDTLARAATLAVYAISDTKNFAPPKSNKVQAGKLKNF